MRKNILDPLRDAPAAGKNISWLDLEQLAQVEVTSEDLAHPIATALARQSLSGWRAGTAGEQTIRIFFDQPQSLHRVQLLFMEDQRERQQEFALRWSTGKGQPVREIVRQQYHFSPGGSVRELEDYQLELEGAWMLELTILPDTTGGEFYATLARMRLA